MRPEYAKAPYIAQNPAYISLAEEVEAIYNRFDIGPEDNAGVVYYCDGGSRPGKTVMAGWGVHGYFFSSKEPKQGCGCKSVITATGYGKVNEKPVTPVGYIDLYGPIEFVTNNAAEAEAVIRALIVTLVAPVKTANFLCDSRYVLTGCTDRLERMRSLDFCDSQTRQPIPNAGAWRLISTLIQACTEKGVVLTWEWVKGHSGNLGNEKADTLAGRAISQGRNDDFNDDIRISPAKGYWNPMADYDRFMNESRWFFQMSDAEPKANDGRHTYYMGNSAIDDQDHGVPEPSVNYAVLRVPTQNEVLATIEKRTRELCAGNMMHQVIVGRLDAIFNPTHYSAIANSGVNWLQRRNPRRLDLWVNDKVAVTQEIKPVRKSYILATIFNSLEETLIRAEKMEPGALENGFAITDITNSIYEAQITPKKAVFKIAPSIDNGNGYIKVPVMSPIDGAQTDITLTIGIDTPKRNMLAAIAAEDVRVLVVTWMESKMAFRYATVVKTRDRSGIWAAVHSNVRIIA